MATKGQPQVKELQGFHTRETTEVPITDNATREQSVSEDGIFKLLRNPGIDSASLFSLAGQYSNPIPTWSPEIVLKFQHSSDQLLRNSYICTELTASILVHISLDEN